jgi:hypothetical protein
MAVKETFVSEIKPLQPLFKGKKEAPKKSWQFIDNSRILYPKGTDGKSMKVTLIIRELHLQSEGCEGATVFRVVKNAGKWSFKIHYRMKDKPTSMKAEKFFAELNRMGGWSYSRAFVMPVMK